jgi:hypothetical protein
MNYGIEKDEEGNEALYMNATVRNNRVELDWVHVEDDDQSYAQRGLARIQAITSTDTPSFPPESAFLAMRLYRRGDVVTSVMVCADGFREQAVRLATEAVLDLYDSVFPDVATKAHAFVEKNIKDVNHLAVMNVDPILEAGVGKQLAPDQLLPHFLDQAKAELEETGEVVQRLGWFVNNRMALVPAAPPFEKYRFFRAVSEVARRVNADAVVQVSDCYRVSCRGERTGEEILTVSWINPDGTCAIMASGYTRRKHPLLSNDIITFSTDISAPSRSEQNLIAPWGSFQPN